MNPRLGLMRTDVFHAVCDASGDELLKCPIGTNLRQAVDSSRTKANRCPEHVASQSQSMIQHIVGSPRSRGGSLATFSQDSMYQDGHLDAMCDEVVIRWGVGQEATCAAAPEGTEIRI